MDHFIFFVFLAFIVFPMHTSLREKASCPQGKAALADKAKKRPHEAPAPCDGAAAVLAESKDRGPLKESLEELKPSVQLVSNQEDLRKAQKAVQTAHRRHSRQQKLREGILWSVILEKNGKIDRTFAFADGTAALLQPRFPVTLMGPCPFLERNVPMKDVIFFDLDGTLTKSEEGIIRCVQYALRELGMPVPAKGPFYFIGPPLVDSFLTLPGFTEAMALEATALYRKRYTAIGIFENELYPGITDLLEALDEAGFLLATASAKPEVFVRHITDHFGLTPYFREIGGASFDASRRTKSAVIAEVLNRLGLQKTKERVLMVGDTAYDVEGARKIGIDCVGVTYGYGKETELAAAHPLGLAATVEALKDGLLTHAFG